MSSPYPILDNKPIDQWKVTELKDELRRRKLTTKGLKEDLVKRLFESIRSESEEAPDEDESDDLINSDSVQEATHKDGHTESVLGTDSEKESLDLSGSKSKETESDLRKVDENNSHSDVAYMVNRNDEESAGAVRNEEKKAGNNAHSPQSSADGAKSPEIRALTEKSLSTDETMVDYEEAIPSEAMQDDGVNDIPVHPEDSLHDRQGKDPQFFHEDALNSSTTVDQVLGVEHHSGSSFPPSHLEPENRESVQNEYDSDTQRPSEDVIHDQVEQNNQVSEVNPNLGFQVSTELISSDSVSINKKNELKDNLNANDFPLELEVIKPEMVHSSSSDVAPVGGDLQTLDTVHEPGISLEPSEEMDVTVNSEDGIVGKKVDGVEAGYTEKLNLDRSSGEESVEEDVLETKQVDFNITVGEVDKKLVGKLHEEGFGLDANASRSFLEDIVIQEESMPATSAEKRKPEGPPADTVRANEPSKRQRRWNSEPVKVPEHLPSNLTPSSTPKASFQPTPKRSFTRSDSTVSEDSPKERIVPPSQKPPTKSLRIDRFLRPFTLKAVQELLAKTGKLCSFWMDNIKTHCYVTYSSEEEAVATRNAVYNLQWPPNGGRLLVAEFVDPQEVKSRIEAPPESPAPISPSPRTPIPQTQASQQPARQLGVKQQLPPPPPLPPPPALADPPILKERQQLPPPPRKKPEPPKPEQPVLTLDDLFMKTKTTPRIYFLPQSEEVAAKRRAQQAKVTRD